MHARPVLPNDQMPSNALSLFVPAGAPTLHSLGLAPGLILGGRLGQQSQTERSLYAESPSLGQCPPSQHAKGLLLDISVFVVGENIGKRKYIETPGCRDKMGDVSGVLLYVHFCLTACLNINVADFHAISIIHILIL